MVKGEKSETVVTVTLHLSLESARALTHAYACTHIDRMCEARSELFTVLQEIERELTKLGVTTL